jgi:hypothetical protein
MTSRLVMCANDSGAGEYKTRGEEVDYPHAGEGGIRIIMKL